MTQVKQKDNKEEYTKAVCYFLAEQLRVHKISLRRAADIGQKVLNNLGLIETERDFLLLVKELSKDFEELAKLEQRIFFYVEETDRKQMEKAVRDFVIAKIAQDVKSSLLILVEAVKDKTTTQSLEEKFPEFKQFTSKRL